MKKKKDIRIPNYSLSEELINSISHGIGGGLAIAALILMIIKANTSLEVVCCTLFGTTLILLYIISSIYHALSPRIKGKKILRVIDHINVFLLVWGTYFVISLIGVGGIKGILLLIFVSIITIIGIVLSSINIDKYQIFEVICHLLNGWSIALAFTDLLNNIGKWGVLLLILGGVLYSIGAIIYGIGAKKKYMHSIFHIFCLVATISHFFCVYLFVI